MCADFLQKNWGMFLCINCELPTTLYALQGPRSEHAYLLKVKKYTVCCSKNLFTYPLEKACCGFRKPPMSGEKNWFEAASYN
jgi:hypothetical protein